MLLRSVERELCAESGGDLILGEGFSLMVWAERFEWA